MYDRVAMSGKSIPLVLAAVFVTTVPYAADPAQSAEVSAHAAHRGGEIVYRYEVRNDTAGRLDHFALGCDCRLPGQQVLGAQLGALPAATTAVGEDDRGLVLDFPPGTLTSPPGWHATARIPRGESRYWIEWHTFDPAAAIPSNRTLTGFAVALPLADPTFLTGSYLVADAPSGQARGGRVRPADVTPPRLSVELRIEGAGDPQGTLTVASAVHASDDVDPEPRVHLESFQREEAGEGEPGAGRLAVTYRASDASGNTSRETARIGLPDGTLARVVGLPVGGILP